MWSPKRTVWSLLGVFFIIFLSWWTLKLFTWDSTLVNIEYKQSIQLWVEPFFYESTFFSNTLVQLLPKTCDVRFEIKFRPYKDDGVSKSIILGVSGLRDDEREEALQSGVRIGFIHMSDEMLFNDISFYDKFAFVFRHYLRPKSSLEYLKRNQSCSSFAWFYGNVFWLPLGYGLHFHSSPVFVQPLSSRPLLFSWVGSTAGKPSRSVMLDAINAHQNATFLKENSMIRDTVSFNNENEMLKGMGYSAYIYMSKFIPCPEGGSPEQFRIYEALEAGAIPIVQKGQEALEYLKELELDVLYVDTWGKLPETLIRLSKEPSEKIDLWQQRLYQQWQSIRHRLQSFFACTVCKFVGKK